MKIFNLNKENLSKMKGYLTENNKNSIVVVEDYPQQFDMKHFKELKTFKDRIAYCEANLKRLASGSSRIVYQIDNQKVLKLAKNEKGIAQNEAEYDVYKHSYYGEEIATQIFDIEDHSLWVESEFATKVTPNAFKQYIDGVDFKNFAHYLQYKIFENQGKTRYMSAPSPEISEKLDNNEFTQNLINTALEMDLVAGDLTRISSYGIVNRGGENHLVLTDSGATGHVISTYYSK